MNKSIGTIIKTCSAIIFSGLCLYAGEIYHSFHETASIPIVDKRNIDKDSLPKMYIRETYNENNQVTEIRFISNGKVWNTHTAFEVPIIKYSYHGNKIIETYYDSDGSKHSGIETGLPFRSIYELNSNGEILDCTFEAYISPIYEKEIDSLQLDETIKSIEDGRTCDFIWYYAYSVKKNNGTFPRKKHIKLVDIKRQFQE